MQRLAVLLLEVIAFELNRTICFGFGFYVCFRAHVSGDKSTLRQFYTDHVFSSRFISLSVVVIRPPDDNREVFCFTVVLYNHQTFNPQGILQKN